MPDAVKDAGGAGEQGTPDAVKIDLENPDVKKLVEAAVADAVQGLTTNRDTILGEKKDLQQKFDELGEQWKGLDPSIVKNLVDRMNNDEETKLIAEGKIDEVIERRVGAMKTDLEARLTAAQEKVTELEESSLANVSKVKKLVMDGLIRQAGGELKILPTAFDDAIHRANGRFELDEDDSPVARDDHGTLLMGKDGKTPLSPLEWLDGMREKAPHWFPTPTGAGAGGGSGGQTGSFTLTRSQARDPQVYQTAKAEAAKAGQELQLIEG